MLPPWVRHNHNGMVAIEHRSRPRGVLTAESDVDAALEMHGREITRLSSIENLRADLFECQDALERYRLDAAILFSDLLLPLEPMGIRFDFIKGEGPAIENPIQDEADIARLRRFEPREALAHVLEAIRQVQRALAGRKAWITGLRAAQAATRDGLPVRSFDAANGDGGLEKFNPLAAWSEDEVWAYILLNEVPYNALHDSFYPSIGCAPCTRPITPGEDVRAGRWWWENPESKECGLHVRRT